MTHRNSKPLPPIKPNTMKNRFALPSAVIAGLAAILTGCIEMEQQVTLNPDGSGKLTVTSAVAIPDLGGLGGDGAKPDPRGQAREIVVGILRSEGIEAWTNVKYEVGKDGKSRATATGFFPDVTKVRISNQLAGDKVEKESLGISKNADGNWVLEPGEFLASKKDAGDDEDGKKEDADEKGDADKEDDKEDDKDAGKEEEKEDAKKDGDKEEDAEEAKKLTDEEVEAKLIQERQQWAAMKGFMGAFLQGIKARVSLQGGGTIVEASVFKKEGENKASLEVTGQQILDAIEKILQDDEKAKNLIRQGKSPTSGGDDDPEEFFKAAFGESTPRVVMKPGEPAFDYKAEVTKAKASQSAELKALLEAAKKPPKKNVLNLNPGGGPEADAKPAEEPKKSKPKARKID